MQIFNHKFLLLALFLLTSSLNINKVRSNTENINPNLNFEESLFDKNNHQYILGPGDEIELNFYSNPEYNGNYKIINDGTIAAPFIGSINISGQTIEDATIAIEKSLAKEFVSPRIYLRIIKTRPIRVSIIGEVNKPGYYTLEEGIKGNDTSSTTNLTSGMPTLIDALRKADWINKNSDISSIEIMRKLPDKYTNELKNTNVNLFKMLFEGDQKQNLILFDGDIIKVKRGSYSDIKKYEISRANLSKDIIKVYVIGEVINPGLVNLSSNTNLKQAIFAAGGLSPSRSSLTAELYRIDSSGKSFTKRYKINNKNETLSEDNPQLMTGDVIKVKRNIKAATGDVVKPIIDPLEGLLSIYRLIDLISE